MKSKKICLCLIVLFTYKASFAAGWHLISVPGRVDSGQGNCKTPIFASGFGIGDYGYAGTGENSFWRYNPLSNTWQDVACPAPARQQSISFTIGGKIYFGCGTMNDLWQLDTGTGVWTQMANYPGVVNPTSPYSEKTLVLGDSAYFGYGNNFYQYTPASNTWAHKRAFPGSSTGGSTLLSLNGVGYYIGPYNNEVWAYYPGSDTFIQKNSLASLTDVIGGFVSNNRAYIFVSLPSFEYGDSLGQIVVEQYNDTSDSWALVSFGPPDPFLPGNQSSHVSFAIGSNGYIGSEYVLIGGGYAIDPNFWEYNPDLNTWAQRASLAFSSNNQTEAVTIDSVAYVFGGSLDPNYATNALWSYNGNSEKWLQKAHFPGTARSRAIGFAINGIFYTGGGFDYLGGTLYDFWQYDPASDTWAQKDSLPTTNIIPVAAGTLGGGVVVNGLGYYNTYTYNPATDTWAPADSLANFPEIASPALAACGANVFSFLPMDPQLIPYNVVNKNSGPTYTVPANVVDTITSYNMGNLTAHQYWCFARGGKVDFLNGRLFYELDTLTGSITRLLDFPGLTNTDATGFVIGNKIYYGFGDSIPGAPHINSFWEYDDNYTPPTANEDVEPRYLKLYPNPVTNTFTIEWDIFAVTPDFSVQVLDMLGRTVTLPWVKNTGTITFNTQALPSGIYTVQIESAGLNGTQRFIKLQ